MIFCYIISSLALLAAVANIILFCVEKKRTADRFKAMLEYIDNICEGTLAEAECFMKEYVEANSEKLGSDFLVRANSINAQIGAINICVAELRDEIEKLKAGTVPDYEAAKAAANAVNDFNAGLSAIMNFDPIAVARSRRQGGEREAV